MSCVGRIKRSHFVKGYFKVVLLEHVQCVTVYVPKYLVMVVWSFIFVSNAMRPDISITLFIIESVTLLVTVFLWHQIKLLMKTGIFVTAGLDKYFNVLATFSWFPI